MQFKEGDKVRTNAEWNEDHEPIQGIVTEVKTLKCSKITGVYDERSGLISVRFVPGQFEYHTVLCDGTDKELNESWFEKVA